MKRSIVILALILSALLAQSKSLAETSAFSLQGVSQPSSPVPQGMYGWEFSPVENQITQLGVFDVDGDGLANAHQIGLWYNYDYLGEPSRPPTFLASVTIPAGTDAQLINGFRYMPIPPVDTSPFYKEHRFVIAVQFGESDLDSIAMPSMPRFAPGTPTGPPPVIPLLLYGRYATGPEFTYPFRITGAPEGQLGQKFWYPNYRYEVIPEPGSAALFAIGAIILILYKRRPSPSTVPSPHPT